MKFLNPAIPADLAAAKPLRLNLGAGPNPLPGFYSLDHLPLPTTDILADLNDPLDLLPDRSVAELHTRHTLEHIDNFLPLMQELHRILRPDASLHIIVPHFSNPLAWSDPTHVRFFGLYTFYYFVDPPRQPRRKVPHFYTPVRFIVDRLRIRFDRETLLGKLTAPFLDALVNLTPWTQALYERRFPWLFPAAEIECILRPANAVPPEPSPLPPTADKGI
ncbi:MAG TPA: methyltransferase type 11 [Phycisphaerae bacterium]|nr:methyltransferase type 11 [Phycisphaerae bacterium]